MSLQSRVQKLEERSTPAREQLILVRDLHDRELFRGDGQEYRRGVNWPDEEKYALTIIRFVYDDE